MNDEVASREGAFVGGTKYLFFAPGAKNFLVAIIFQLFYEVQAMLVE
jgi:hypothetical protein